MKRLFLAGFAFLLAISGLFSAADQASADAGSIESVMGPWPSEAYQKALEQINEIRRNAGIGELELDSNLTLSAQNHADYLDKKSRWDTTMPVEFKESEGEAGFSGVSPKERAAAAGFPFGPDTYVMEVIKDFQSGGLKVEDALTRAINDFIHSLPERADLLDPKVTKIGFGFSEKMGAVVFDMSRHARQPTSEPTVYPYDGQTDVPVRFTNEYPYAMYHVMHSGYMISFLPSYPEGDIGDSAVSARITNSNGDNIPFYEVEGWANSPYFYFPVKQLDYNETYTVSVDWAGRNTTWTFTTMDNPDESAADEPSDVVSTPERPYVPESFAVSRYRGAKQVSSHIYSDGYALSKKADYFGYIDENAKEAIPYEYDDARNFSEGLAAVYDSGKQRWGYIDKQGTLVIPYMYKKAEPFTEGRGAVQNADGKWGYIDLNGKVVIPFQYDDVEMFTYGTAGANQGGLWGYIDLSGKIVVPFKYDDLSTTSKGNKHPRYDEYINLNFNDNRKTTEFYSKLDKKLVDMDTVIRHRERQEMNEKPKGSADLSLGRQYADFEEGRYWTENMLWALSLNMITGFEEKNPQTGKTEKLLKPKDRLTEAQFLTIFFRYKDPLSFTVIAPAVDWWASIPYQLTTLSDLPLKGSLNNQKAANAPITRGEMATILASYHNGKRMNMRDSVQFMYDAGLTNGYPDANGNTPKTYQSYGVNDILLREHIVTFMRNYDSYLRKQ